MPSWGEERRENMEKHDYYEAVKDDLIDLINDQYVKRLGDFKDLDEFRDKLYDDAFLDDGVTGNGSGSYTFSTWEAEENLAHNWDLLEEMLAEFGDEFDLSKGVEHYDVCLRCYVLSQVIDDAIEEAGIDEDDKRFWLNSVNDDEEEEAE